MSNILTPVSLWKDFDDSLDVSAETLSEKIDGEIRTEYLNFYGRDTGAGRVKIFAAFASNKTAAADSAVILLPDSYCTVDDVLVKFFVKRGYSVLMPDYRGKWQGAENYTVYPENVSYANLAECGRHKDYVDEDASKTSWYEWVAAARYCYKYLLSRGITAIARKAKFSMCIHPLRVYILEHIF